MGGLDGTAQAPCYDQLCQVRWNRSPFEIPRGRPRFSARSLERTLPLLAEPYVQQYAEEQEQQEEVRGVEAGERHTPVG